MIRCQPPCQGAMRSTPPDHPAGPLVRRNRRSQDHRRHRGQDRNERSGRAPRHRPQRRRRLKQRRRSRPTALGGPGADRRESPATGYRLPDELLAELASTSAELQLPIGLLVTAAIARLLDEPAAAIAALVDRADDARIEGRRAARRSASGRHPEAPTGHPKRPVRCRWSWALISVATRQSTPQSTRSW